MTILSTLKPSYWVVVPAYNEEKYIGRVLKKIKRHTSQIIVIDDGSQDNTSLIAAKHTQIVLRHPVNLGKGAALKTGCDYVFGKKKARGVMLIDSDDQHDPQELVLFQEQLEKGNQIVFGIRELTQDMPLIKRFGNVFLSLLVYVLYGKYFTDVLSGYKAFTKKAYAIIRWESPDYAVELEIAIRVAKNKLQKKGVMIKTIYHDHDRGMTLLDALHFLALLLNWRVSL